MDFSRSDGSAQSRCILASPFFRTETILGLAHDSLASESFPRKQLGQVFTAIPSSPSSTIVSVGNPSSLPESSCSDTLQVPTLNEAQHQALADAIKALSSQLALPENQLQLPCTSTNAAKNDVYSAETAATCVPSRITLNHIRLQLGGCLFLAGELARSAAQLELITNDLRPTRNRHNSGRKKRKDSRGQEPALAAAAAAADGKSREGVDMENKKETPTPETRSSVASNAETALRFEALVALARIRRLQGMDAEALKYERWADTARESQAKH